jgi:hypothetical protein
MAARKKAPARKRSARKSAQPAKGKRKYWSQRATQESDALDLENKVFAQRSPARIAASLKRSADRSRRRKTTPYRSAMSMLTFYINRAGHTLPATQKKVLERAKDELRRLYGRA